MVQADLAGIGAGKLRKYGQFSVFLGNFRLGISPHTLRFDLYGGYRIVA